MYRKNLVRWFDDVQDNVTGFHAGRFKLEAL